MTFLTPPVPTYLEPRWRIWHFSLFEIVPGCRAYSHSPFGFLILCQTTANVSFTHSTHFYSNKQDFFSLCYGLLDFLGPVLTKLDFFGYKNLAPFAFGPIRTSPTLKYVPK